MRYRFSARTKDGELRNGQLEAADEASARAQLLRRGLTVERLESDTSETPVHIQTRAFKPAPAVERTPRWWEAIDWQHLDRRKLFLLAAAALALLWLGLGVLRWVLSDRKYHIHLSGQIKLSGVKQVTDEIYDKLRPRLWLPQVRWVVNEKGEVWAKDAKGEWEMLDRKASVERKFAAEGFYTIDIVIPMPMVPERGMLYFPAGRFRRVSRLTTFRPRKNVFEGEVPTMVLTPRRVGRTASASKVAPRK